MPTTTPPTPSASTLQCPLCGAPNACAMEVEKATGIPQEPCWCTQIDFSKELLARVPASSKGQACICASCAAGGE